MGCREGELGVIRRFRVSVGNKTYEVEIEEIEEAPQKTTAKQLNIAPQAAQRTEHTVKQETKERAAVGKGGVVVCPMSAKVVSIKCKAGEKVKPGDALLVIEAMKMEHTLCAPCGGVILEIKTEEGASVAYNQPLIVIG
jgi:biotin carboxyl carrier protein